MKNLKIMRDERGYALIEILILIAVIAILSAAVLPKISNSFKVVCSRYIMQNIYSELRFLQTVARTANFDKENTVMNMPIVEKVGGTFSVRVVSNQYVFRMTGQSIRRYNLPPNFSFEKTLYMRITSSGTIKDNDSNNSGQVRLKRGTELCKPFIVFDSVGRIRTVNNISN